MSRISNGPYDLLCCDHVSGSHTGRAKVRIAGLEPAGVLDDNCVSVTRLEAGIYNLSLLCGPDFHSCGCREVESLVKPWIMRKWVLPHPITGTYRRLHWQTEIGDVLAGICRAPDRVQGNGEQLRDGDWPVWP